MRRNKGRATQGRRRAYGQHFLRDRSVCESITQATLKSALESSSAELLEVGPGRGAITDLLLARLGALPAMRSFLICEKDRELARRWRLEEKDARVRVLDADFLELRPEDWLIAPPVTVVSNLPYSSGTAIFTELGRYPDRVSGMVLMFQSEVARRLRAERGTKDWGSLSIWTQNRWSVKKLLSVPPGAFSPPPQVQSEVVVLEPLGEPRVAGTGEDSDWNFLLKSCFQHRRKMLRAGLPRSGPLRNALELSGLDDTKRAEALDWDEWGRLYRALVASRREAAPQSRIADGNSG